MADDRDRDLLETAVRPPAVEGTQDDPTLRLLAEEVHVTKEMRETGRVHVSTQVLTALKAAVTERIYPCMGHTINHDEIAQVRGLLEGVNRAQAA